jgi:PAS domain S-box-containing protein
MRSRVLRWVPTVAGVYALSAGTLAISGWALDLPILADWNLDGIAMQPNAGLTAIVTGGSLLLASLSFRRCAAALGLVVIAIGLTALAQNVFSLPAHFIDDSLLFDRPWGTRGTTVPGRMGVPAAISWILAGSALALLWRRERTSAAIPALGLVMMSIAGLSLIGYLLGADLLHTLPRATAIAMQTATVVLMLGIGLVALVPERQPMRILVGHTAGSALARQALPVVMIVPVVLGLLALRGQRAELYDSSMGIALLVSSLIIALCTVLWWGVAAANSREESQRQSDERFALFMQNLPGLAWIKDSAGRYLYINQAAEDVFGVSRELLSGKTDDEIFPDATARQFRENDQQALAEGRGVQVVETLLHDDGLLHYSIVSKFPIAPHSTREKLLGGIAIDITDRKRAEETVSALLRISKRLNSTLDVDELLDILVQEVIDLVGTEGGAAGLMSPEGMVAKRYFQRGAAVPLDYCWPPLHGLPGWLIVHKTSYLTNDASADPQIVPELCEQFGVWSALSTPIMTAQGEVIGFFEIHNKRSGAGFTPADQDLLESVSQTAAIAVQNALAYRSLQEAQAALKQDDRRKDEFLAVLAHELRNPLAPIRNGLEIVKLGVGDNSVLLETQRAMERQVTHLVRLVDDLLDLSRISRDKLELRSKHIELASVIRQAVETAQPLTDQQQQTIVLSLPDAPLTLEADPVRLAQVFSNLLNNASKFSPPQSRIVISAAREGSDVLVSVKDAGIGIPPDRIGEVFEMFTQIHRTFEKASGGLGIGLTLVRRLVEMHGGTIAAHSAGEGQGSEFVVRLPLSVASPPRPLPPVPDESDVTAAACRVLVVDDNRDAATTLGALLRLAGHAVALGYDGLEACELAQTYRPHVILLDIGLPGMNGYEACRRIRETAAGRKIVMIALTGWGQDYDRRQSSTAGFDEHLVKPVDFEILRSLLAQVAPEACPT